MKEILEGLPSIAGTKVLTKEELETLFRGERVLKFIEIIAVGGKVSQDMANTQIGLYFGVLDQEEWERQIEPHWQAYKNGATFDFTPECGAITRVVTASPFDLDNPNHYRMFTAELPKTATKEQVLDRIQNGMHGFIVVEFEPAFGFSPSGFVPRGPSNQCNM